MSKRCGEGKVNEPFVMEAQLDERRSLGERGHGDVVERKQSSVGFIETHR